MSRASDHQQRAKARKHFSGLRAVHPLKVPATSPGQDDVFRPFVPTKTNPSRVTQCYTLTATAGAALSELTSQSQDLEQIP